IRKRGRGSNCSDVVIPCQKPFLVWRSACDSKRAARCPRYGLDARTQPWMQGTHRGSLVAADYIGRRRLEIRVRSNTTPGPKRRRRSCCRMSAFGVKRTLLLAVGMFSFYAVDGARSAASKWDRMIASKPERFKEVRPGNEMAFEVFKELARARRRNADTVDPGIGRTRLGQRTLKCVFLIGTRSAHSIRASGLTAAQTGRTHDRT